MQNKKRRGFHFPVRITVIGALIALQIALLILLIIALSEQTVVVYFVFEAISIMMVIHNVNKPGNPSYKITWIIVILLFPLFGGLFYLFWGDNRISPGKRRRWSRIEAGSARYLSQDAEVEQALWLSSPFYARQSRYLKIESGYPVYSNTLTDCLSPGEKILPKLLELLESAQRYIFIEFFILAQGHMWDQIHAVLRRKAAAGVEIRMIFDDIGSCDRQYKGFMQGLRSEGIKIAVFNPFRPSVDVFLNNRNHRKIVVADGIAAMTGGINVGDEYINELNVHGYWMDSAVFLRGDAAWSFTVMFLEMWQFVTKRSTDISGFYPLKRYSAPGFVQPYCDGPLSESCAARGIYMQIIAAACRYVYIVSPYLILDSEMIGALVQAARSGIDVRIVTPKNPDKWYVHTVTHYNYTQLLKSGIRIFEYTPGFVHSKLFIADDSVATVGSVNMDYRSYYFHFECGCWMYNTQAVLQVREDVRGIFAASEEILYEKWKKRPVGRKIMQSLLHLAAPFM